MPDDHFQQQPDREARIRECAYHLWESSGKPYGRDVEFWQRARQLIAREDGAASPRSAPAAAEAPAAPAAAPAPRRRRTPASRRPPKAS
jgi:hypothetical protein